MGQKKQHFSGTGLNWPLLSVSIFSSWTPTKNSPTGHVYSNSLSKWTTAKSPWPSSTRLTTSCSSSTKPRTFKIKTSYRLSPRPRNGLPAEHRTISKRRFLQIRNQISWKKKLRQVVACHLGPRPLTSGLSLTLFSQSHLSDRNPQGGWRKKTTTCRLASLAEIWTFWKR